MEATRSAHSSSFYFSYSSLEKCPREQRRVRREFRTRICVRVVSTPVLREYGMGNEVSTCGDVYSFGISLLEMFTGKRPTSDVFKADISLHDTVREALPEHVPKILDNALLEDIGVEMDTAVMFKVSTSILEIALSCSTEVPEERLDMSDVVTKLSSIRNKFLQTPLQQQSRVQAGASAW